MTSGLARNGLLMLALVFGTSGCGETNIQAIHRLRPAYDVYRNSLASVIVNLQPPGTVQSFSAPRQLFPAPIFNEARFDDPKSTAEIIYLGEQKQDVHLSIQSPVHFCLGWTGPKNPLSPDVWDDRGNLGAECEAALRHPWLVLLRVVESRLPERLFMEAFLIYVPNWKVTGSFPVVVNGRYREKDLGEGEWRKRAHPDLNSAFHEAASCELMMQLNNLPDARFQFPYRKCQGAFLDIAEPASLSKQVAGEVKESAREPSPSW